jgi:hypothetical protein
VNLNDPDRYSMGAAVPLTIPDIYSPEAYLAAPPYEAFAELRRTRPVYWQDMPGEPGRRAAAAAVLGSQRESPLAYQEQDS